MPFVYDVSLATPGNLTTNGTTNVETDTFSIKAGARDVYLRALEFGGKANAATTLSGMSIRLAKLATASTGGTGMTGAPCDPGAQAHKATCLSRPTIGTTRTNRGVYACGVSSRGGFKENDPAAMIMLEAAGAPSIDGIDSCAALSVPFEFSLQIQE